MDTDLAIFDKVIAINTDIAGPIVFLLSDAASMITGVTLPIDGGYSSR
jgi:L-xylulose reductase